VAKRKGKVPDRALPAVTSDRKVPRRLRGVVPNDNDPDVIDRKPAWGFSLVDLTSHEWSASPTDGATLLEILNFLQGMERLTWREIRDQITGGNTRRGPKHKTIPVESLIPAAQARLAELELDDHTELFRFRLGNMKRLWGVFVGGHHVFYPVWWDPDHKICPSRDR